ncbi:MAG: diguanylate cyclase, partial [Alphaproteobacteria bacterium]|nr:diguanylate cyclase [Alphaproteobacteria bacterium]
MDAANKPSSTFTEPNTNDPQAGQQPHEMLRSAAVSLERDVQGRLQELKQRDDLSDIITAIVTDILNAAVIKEALPRALDTLSAHIRFDRMVAIEVPEHENSKVVFTWTSPGLGDGVDIGKLILKRSGDPQVCEWVRPLRQGKPVFAARGMVIGSMREFLTEAAVSAVLLVPVMVGGRFWGQIGFDDRKSGERWKPHETTALKTFADFLGVALTRERFLNDVHQRDKLLQTVTQSAAAIVTSPYLHEAISQSLESVAQTLDVDRMHVLEIVPGTGGQEQCLLRNNWQGENVSPELDTLLRPMSESYAASVTEWMAPLRNNHAIQGHVGQAVDGLKEYFERLRLFSTLIVPIMLDGKYWGRIGFDDCTKERKWTETEIGILKTLADLIGTAIMRERYVEELGKANTIIQNSPTILFRLRGEPSFPMIYISQNISLFGYVPEELLNSPTLYQSYIHPGDRTKVQSAMAEMLRKDASARTIENRMVVSTGESRWVETRHTPVRDTNGRLIEVEGIMIDITERKAAEEKIALLARTDPLTGLANRATFGGRLRQALAAMKRGTAPFAILYLDLDRFKEINDTLGHPVGDKLLQAVADRLRAVTRKTDLVARLGGDEFSILQ